MDLLDLLIVLIAIFAALGGFRLGFVARVLSWVGLVVGLFLASLFVTQLVADLKLTTSTERVVVAVLIVCGFGLIGSAVGLALGTRVHAIMPLGGMRSADRWLGAVVAVAGVLAAFWLLLPAVSSVSGWPATATRNSAISKWMSRHLPPPPNTLQTLGHLVGNIDFPQVFAGLTPGAVLAPPPSANPLTTAVTNTVAASTVEVEGQACNYVQVGSGFAIANDLVLTNAHVVAGEPAGQTSVVELSGRRLSATVVRFDPDRDVALLSVPGLDLKPLTLTTGSLGAQGAVFGHPGGQTDLAVQPASIAQEITAVGRNLYGTTVTNRDVYVLSSKLAPGDSGGALVDSSGQVVGVAFAIAVDEPTTAYALTSAEVQPVISEGPSATPVSTGACLND
ncbi:MAG: MarP family serine protease [Acidimicrobiales bacterium]